MRNFAEKNYLENDLYDEEIVKSLLHKNDGSGKKSQWRIYDRN